MRRTQLHRLEASNLGQIIGRARGESEAGMSEPSADPVPDPGPGQQPAVLPERAKGRRWTPTSPSAQRVLDFVRGRRRAVSSAEISGALDVDQQTVCNLLTALGRAGELLRSGTRCSYRYTLPELAAP